MAPNFYFSKDSNSVIYVLFKLNFGMEVLNSHLNLILSWCCVQLSILRKLLSFPSKKYLFLEISGFQRAITPWNRCFFWIASWFWKAKILYFKMIYGSNPPPRGGMGGPGPIYSNSLNDHSRIDVKLIWYQS